MKKQTLKTLALNKKSISKLNRADIAGGGTDDPRSVIPNCYGETTVRFCPFPCIYTVSACFSVEAC